MPTNLGKLEMAEGSRLLEQPQINYQLTSSRNNDFDSITAYRQATTNRYDRFLRLLLRDPIALRLIISTCLRLQGNEFFLLRSPSIPLQNKKTLHSVQFFNRVTRGIQFFSQQVWTPSLLTLMVHDIIRYYTAPDLRYDSNSIGKILLGISTNQQSWATYLGSDLPGEATFWLMLAGLTVTPLLIGIAHWLTRLSWQEQTSMEQYRHLLTRLNNHDMQSHKLLQVQQFYSQHQSVARAEFMVLWDGLLGDSERVELVGVINKLAHTGNIIIQLRAVQAIAAIADTFLEKDLRVIESRKIVDLSGLRQLRDSANEMLNEHSQFKGRAEMSLMTATRSVYANYLRWTMGRNTRRPLEMLFWPLAAISSYAGIRLAQTIVLRVTAGINYFVSARECRTQNNVWNYMRQVGNYVCTVCGDWPVYINDMNDIESCLRGLFAQQHAPQILLDRMQRILTHPNFRTVNLSRQNLTAWTQPEWQLLFSMLARANSPNPLTLDLSQTNFNPIWFQDDRINALTNFLRVMPVRQLSLRNLGLGTHEVSLVIAALNPQLEILDISGCAIGDTELVQIGRALPGLRLQQLNLADNDCTDDGVNQFAPFLQNSTIVSFDISGNRITGDGANAFAPAIANGRLRDINFSQNYFSDIDLTPLGEAIKQSAMTSISLSQCQLDGNQIANLSPYFSRVSNLNLSGNNLSGYGFVSLVYNLQNSSMTNLNLASTGIADDGLAAVTPYLPNTNIRDLNMAENEFTVLGLQQFVPTLPRSLEAINLAGNYLGDQGLFITGEALINSSSALQHFNFSNNAVTANGGAQLFAVLPHSITAIDVSNNYIDNRVIISLRDNSNHLNVINFADTLINSTGAELLADILPHSSLQEINLSGNAIDNNAANKIASKLVTPAINNLAAETLTQDAARALDASKATSNLSKIDLSRTKITAEGAQPLCLVLPRTKIAMNNFLLTDNVIDHTKVDITNCQISPATRLKPWQVFSWFSDFYMSIKNIFQHDITIYFPPEENSTVKTFTLPENFSLSGRNFLDMKQLWLPERFQQIESRLTPPPSINPIVVLSAFVLLYLLCKILQPIVNSIMRYSKNTFWQNPKKPTLIKNDQSLYGSREQDHNKDVLPEVGNRVKGHRLG